MSAVVTFEDVDLELVVDGPHEWLLSSADVAAGFGCSPEAIRQAKSRRSGELIEGRHWVVTDRHTLGGAQQVVMWTKRGVVRLGFMVTSDRARRFRDFAEDLVVASAQPTPSPAAAAAASPLALAELMLTELKDQAGRLATLEATTKVIEFEHAEDRMLVDLVHQKVDRRDPDDPQLQPITVTTIGSLLVPPLSGMRVNRLLQELGLQWFQDDRWVPTHDGRPYAVTLPVQHASGRWHEHLQWQRRVVTVIERRLARRRTINAQVTVTP
jgi:prophage antirepressor-like protein